MACGKNRPSGDWIVFDHNGCLTFKSLLTTMPVSVINVCSTTRLKHRWSLTAWLRRQNWRRPPETDLKAHFALKAHFGRDLLYLESRSWQRLALLGKHTLAKTCFTWKVYLGKDLLYLESNYNSHDKLFLFYRIRTQRGWICNQGRYLLKYEAYW